MIKHSSAHGHRFAGGFFGDGLHPVQTPPKGPNAELGQTSTSHVVTAPMYLSDAGHYSDAGSQYHRGSN